jgi:hypothetical protein
MKRKGIFIAIAGTIVFASGFMFGASGFITRALSASSDNGLREVTDKDLKIEYYLEMQEDSVIIQSDLGDMYKCHLDDVVKTLVDDNQ